MTPHKPLSLFYKCLFFSITLHIIGLWVFYLQPIFLQPVITTFFGKSGESVAIPLTEEDIALSEKNIALEEVFNQIVVLAPGLRRPNDMPTLRKESAARTEESFQPPAINLLADLPKDKLLDALEEIPVPAFEAPAFALPVPISLETHASPLLPPPPLETSPTQGYIHDLRSLAIIEAGEDLPSEYLPLLEINYPPIHEEEGAAHPPKPQGAPTQPLAAAAPEMLALVSPDDLARHPTALDFIPSQSFFLGLRNLAAAAPAAPASTLPPLLAYALPKSSAPLEWTDDFDVVVHAVQQEEGKHLFSVSLTPKFDLAKRRMRQNVYFLVDRSNSIDRHRYRTFKRAVARALQSLQEGDRFNIVVFDSKIAQLSQKPLAYTPKSRQFAEDFLEKQPHGTYFAATDIYQALPKIIPADLAEDEIHTAILISDGASATSTEKKHQLLRSWIAKNNGRVALYTAAVGKDNDLVLLDLLSTFSHGRLLYSDTHTSFPRKLSKLVLDLRYPIAKEMEITFMKADPGSGLELLSPSISLPLLFSNRPFVVYGAADKLSDFTILIQGWNKSEPLSIKKTISLSKAKPGGRTLAAQWSTLEARRYFTAFLQEGRSADLKQAQALLSHDTSHPRR